MIMGRSVRGENLHWLSAYSTTDMSRGSHLDEMSHFYQVTAEQNEEVVPGMHVSTNPEGRPGGFSVGGKGGWGRRLRE